MTRDPALRTCPECGQAFPGAPGVVGQWLRPLRALRFPVTTALMALLGLLFLLSHAVAYAVAGLGDGTPNFNIALWLMGSMIPGLVVGNGETWRVVAAMFLHADILHILFNGLALWNLGRMVENAFGGRVLWVAFFVTGLGGNLVSLGWKTVMSNPAGTIGASGAVCGLLGLLLGALHQRKNLHTDIGKQLIQWVVMIAVFGLLMMDKVDNAAHFGGVAAGFGFSFVLFRVNRLRRAGFSRIFWLTGSILAIALTLATFFLAWRQAGESTAALKHDRAVHRFMKSPAYPAYLRDLARYEVLRPQPKRTPAEEDELQRLQQRLFDARGEQILPPESEWNKGPTPP